jgi:hypothetical protein
MSCLPIYLIDDECMHVALYALLCLAKQSSGAEHSRWCVHAECSVVPSCGEQQSKLCDPDIGRIVTSSNPMRD